MVLCRKPLEDIYTLVCMQRKLQIELGETIYRYHLVRVNGKEYEITT